MRYLTTNIPYDNTTKFIPSFHLILCKTWINCILWYSKNVFSSTTATHSFLIFNFLLYGFFKAYDLGDFQKFSSEQRSTISAVDYSGFPRLTFTFPKLNLIRKQTESTSGVSLTFEGLLHSPSKTFWKSFEPYVKILIFFFTSCFIYELFKCSNPNYSSHYTAYYLTGYSSKFLCESHKTP